MYKQHDHVGFLCGQLWQWRRVVVPFLAQGLTRGERCVYLTSLHTPWLLENMLAWQGLDLQKARDKGQLIIADAARHYLQRGSFEPDRVIERNIAAVEQALRAGFSGLRAVGDMSWAAYHHLDWQSLEQYERRLDREYFAGHAVTAICLYDHQLFPPRFQDMVERAHPLMVDFMGQVRPGRLSAGLH